MERSKKRLSRTAGLSPGTLIHVGEERTEAVKITVFDYDESRFDERTVEKIEDVFPFKDTPTVTWINVDGVHDTTIVERIGSHFELHPLVLEDVVNTSQRPKSEDFEKYIFVVLKMLYYDEKRREVTAEQVSLVLGANFVISFQEKEGDVFDAVRKRIRQNKGRIRRSGADYLTYSLIDAVVDNYFAILESFGEDLEKIEEKLTIKPDQKTLMVIHNLKKDAVRLRRSIWPLREVLGELQRSESVLIKEHTYIYLRDVYDHIIQVVDTVETFRDMVSSLLDIYLSSVSNKMNEVMKVLTIFAAIFIPLTFLAGVYGMNFEYMPELNWRYGYFSTLGLMATIIIVMLAFFKKKKWF